MDQFFQTDPLPRGRGAMGGKDAGIQPGVVFGHSGAAEIFLRVVGAGLGVDGIDLPAGCNGFFKSLNQKSCLMTPAPPRHRPRRKAITGVPEAAASIATMELVSSARLVTNSARASRRSLRFSAGDGETTRFACAICCKRGATSLSKYCW